MNKSTKKGHCTKIRYGNKTMNYYQIGEHMFDFLIKTNSKSLHVNDMDSLLGKIELIDIREPYEYQSGTLRTTKNIPMGTLLTNPEKYLIKGKEYYIMCHSGARSRSTCKRLEKLGYDVVNVQGGMSSYLGTKRK